MNLRSTLALVALCFSLTLTQTQAQMVTSTTLTPTQLVNNILLGGGITASNITYSGANVSRGNFTGGSSISFLMDAGVILTSGSCADVPGWNTSGMTSYNNTAGGDADLDAILTAGSTTNKSVLEFDFVPISDTLVFNYIFASEEYPEFACGSFNDVFAFLLSGPNPAGGNYVKENLAKIPGTSTYVSVNTINPGVAGTNGTAANCTAIDPNWASYSVYYNDNPKNMSVIQIKPDGYTDVFTASASVVAGQTYHIKLAIADVGSISDPDWDSYVFLQSQSFSSPAQTVATVASPTSVCPGTPVKLLATVSGGVADYDYAWSNGTNHLNSLAVKDSITVSPMVTTTYTVTVTGFTGSTSTSTITVNVDTLSTAATAIIATPDTICPGDMTTLSITGGSLGTGANWQWYTQNCGGSLAGSNSTLNVSPTSTTTYWLRANGSCNTTGCVQMQVVVRADDATITAAGPFCQSDAPVTLSAASPGGSWSGTGITNATTGTFSPAVAGNGTFDIIYTTTGNCGASDTTTIIVSLQADATIGPAGPYCASSAPVILTSASAGGNWSGTGITNPSTGQFSPATAGTGTHQVIYTISGSCGSSDTANIVVNADANASITATGPLCVSASPQNLIAVEGGGSWSGTGITSTSTGVFDPATAGVGTHTIIYTIGGACGDADTTSITVVDQMDASIDAAGPFCNNLGIQNLNAADAGGNWSGTGITSATQGTFAPAVAGIGTHDIVYTISGLCGNADTTSIVVLSSPHAVGIGTNESCTGAADGAASVLATLGTEPYTYDWSNNETSTNISGLAPGIYSVVVSDANGCLDSDSVDIEASFTPCEIITPMIFIPNIFSPNGDMLNDVLYVRGQGIKSLTFKIFDRWGEQVFISTDIATGWDGNYRGKQMDAAVFVYSIEAEFENGNTFSDKGNITLTR